MSNWSHKAHGTANLYRRINHFPLADRSMEIGLAPKTATREERPRILIVEPNKTYLGVIARRLGEAGHRIAAAADGAAALAELHRLPVDLVLAELNMPRLSGAELARAIRGEVQWRDLPIMLITGKPGASGAIRAYEAGADDVILKPFHFEVLVARIERRIAWARSFRTLRQDNATLDARVIERAIELGEIKDRLRIAETERLRLESSVCG
jgi:DNA-binding response OmpR family regulator